MSLAAMNPHKPLWQTIRPLWCKAESLGSSDGMKSFLVPQSFVELSCTTMIKMSKLNSILTPRSTWNSMMLDPIWPVPGF